jgi:cobalt-zinc-cadmium efflux system protein
MQNMTGIFLAGIILNALYVVIQIGAGLYTHSMALLSDAGHNFGDVAGLALSLIAFRLARIKPSEKYTYGYKKTTVLAALTNAVILLISIGILSFESVRRIWHPQPVEGGIVAIVAGIGIVINLASALLFFKDKDHDLNTKGAYLHLLTDGLVSLGVVVSALIIKYTGWFWLDGVVSVAILVSILLSTWSLLTGSLRMSLDAVPEDVNVTEIEHKVLATPGVKSMHHTHIWSMSTTETALTTHLVLDSALSFDEKMKLVHRIKHNLLHNKIQHATLELESDELPCEQDAC